MDQSRGFPNRTLRSALILRGGAMSRIGIFWGAWISILALLASTSPPAAAQTIRGVVVGSLTIEPVGEALVTHSGPSGTRSAITGPDGRFELAVEGEPPFELTVQRMGYQERLLVVGSEEIQGELRIGFAVAPLATEELRVEAERERPDFRFVNHLVTDTGLVWRGERASRA